MVPPCSDRISRVPPYSSLQLCITCTGLSPTMARLSRRFHLSQLKHWPSPRSLATTSGVSVDVLSSRYLDVSVPWVCFYSPILFRDRYLLSDNRKSEAIFATYPMPCEHLARTNMTSKFRLSKVGCPIRRSAGQRLFAPHHSISQRTTSFIASYRQGIHQMPLGHLIALISNTHHFTITTHAVGGACSGMTTRQDEHYSERPEVEINLGTLRLQCLPCGAGITMDGPSRRISSLRCR